MIFFIFFGFFFAFFINEFSFTFIKQLRSQANKLFYADTHIHISTRTFTHTHMHTHVRTLKDTWWEALSFTVCLFCFLLISFYVARSPPFGLQMPPKLQSNAVFISFTLSLSLALFLLLLSLLLGEETVNSHTRRWRRLRCRGLCRLLIKRAIFLLLLLLTRRTLCYQHSPPPLLLLLLSRFAFYTFSTPTRRWHCCCCRRRRCCSAVVSVCCCLPLLSRFGFCRVA